MCVYLEPLLFNKYTYCCASLIELLTNKDTTSPYDYRHCQHKVPCKHDIEFTTSPINFQNTFSTILRSFKS